MGINNIADITSAYSYQTGLSKGSGPKDAPPIPPAEEKVSGFEETAAVFERSNAEYPESQKQGALPPTPPIGGLEEAMAPKKEPEGHVPEDVQLPPPGDDAQKGAFPPPPKPVDENGQAIGAVDEGVVASVVEETEEEVEDTTDVAAMTEEKRAELVKQLQNEAQARAQQIVDMVRETLGMQIDHTKSIGELLGEAVEEAKAQGVDGTEATAQSDEDDYWGVEQTAQRIVDFAKTLAGGNTEYASELLEAFKEGYSQAEESFGGELPQVSKDTYDRVIELFDEWTGSTSE
ncbi:MAG: hypothetical protein K6F00_05785 [Lachnospiraceae bacterium]|nr:hypothetical protein [Lachnospiraceae bacterium]